MMRYPRQPILADDGLGGEADGADEVHGTKAAPQEQPEPVLA
nr:hypothetical protein [Delftia acidovorans]